MAWSRVVAAVVLVAGVALAATRATARVSAFPPVVACSAAALAAPYHSVDYVSSFGCDGSFAYLWVTVGTGVAEVSVTEVERYDAARGAWRNAPRATYCTDHRLPAYVREWGCNSN